MSHLDMVGVVGSSPIAPTNFLDFFLIAVVSITHTG